MAVLGTGLPTNVGERVLAQPSGTAPLSRPINADAFSSAQSWQEIAQAGTKLSDAAGDYAKLQIHQTQVGHLAQKDVEIDRTKTDYRDKFANDPQGFDAHWTAYKEGTLGAAEPWAVPHLTRSLGAAGNSAYSQILGETRSRDQKLDVDRVNALATQSEAEVIGHAMRGTFGAPDGVAALEKYRGVMATAVSSRLIAPEEADRRINDLTSRSTAAMLVKDIGNDYLRNRANGEDAGPLALKAAEDKILRGTLPLDEEKRYAYFRKATAEVHALEAERKNDLRGARVAMTDAMFAMSRGVQVDPAALDSISGQLSAAGGQADVAKLRAAAARAEYMASFGRLPPGDQVDSLQVASVSSRIKATPFEGTLIRRESSGNPTLVNQLGYAGLYQFGAPRLEAIGNYRPGANEDMDSWSKTGRNASGKWSGTFNIPGFPDVKKLSDFLANPEAQKAVYDRHQSVMDAEINLRGLNQYIGQTVGGVPITQDGLRAMIHLAGAGGAERALKSGGAVNPRDANGTSALDYARMGQQATFGPGIDPRLAVGMQKEVASTADAEWTKIAKGLDEGVRPTADSLDTVIKAYTLTGNHNRLEEIGSRLDRFDVRAGAGQQPLGIATAAATELQRVGETSGLTPGQSAWLKDLKTVNAATTTALDTDPVRLGVERFPERFRTPAPLDARQSETLQAGLRERARISQFVSQNYLVPATTALSPADVQSIQGALEKADARGKARIFSDLSVSLPEDVRNASLASLGQKSPTAMVQVFAGSIYPAAPDVAESILRGQAAISGSDKRFDPLKEGNKGTFNEVLDKALPSTAFGLAMRTNPTGAYQTMREAIRAHYADRSAQAGDTSADVNEARLQRSVAEVTGGVVEHNGGRAISPRRGMSQTQFEAVLAGVTDQDMAGVTTLNGKPVTTKYLRDNARLESVGDGRYLVQLGADPARPIYAFQNANTESPAPFELDLRGRTPLPDYRRGPPTSVQGQPYPRG